MLFNKNRIASCLNRLDILQVDIDSGGAAGSAALSIVILISTVEFARTIRSFMQMRVHAPAAIAVFNDGQDETARRPGTRISIDVNPELRHGRS